MIDLTMNLRDEISRASTFLGIGLGLYLLLSFTLNRAAPDITIMTFAGFAVAVVAALLASWSAVAIAAVLFGNLSKEDNNPSRLWLAIAYIISTASGVGAFIGVLILLPF